MENKKIKLKIKNGNKRYGVLGYCTVCGSSADTSENYGRCPRCGSQLT